MRAAVNDNQAASPGARLRLVLLLAALASLLWVSSANASEAIESFTVSSSDTQAGGHPDIDASLELANPGQPEAASSVIVDLPEGMFGNSRAVTLCRSVDFALSECPTSSQVGAMAVYANIQGDPKHLLGTAPVFDMEPQSEEETARFALIVPGVNIPIQIPISVRTGSDYGLRLAVSGITQQIPLAAMHLTIWGSPANPAHDDDRFRVGSPGHPAGCPGRPIADCASQFGQSPNAAGIPERPLVNYPTTCSGAPLSAVASVITYQDPANPTQASADFDPVSACEKETFNPVLSASLTSEEADSPAGIDLQLSAPQFESNAASPSQIRSATVLLPQGVSINPDAADGQSSCPDAAAGFGIDGPGHCPDNSKIGNLEIGSPSLAGPLVGSLYIGEPRPGNQYRVFMITDGFGIHSKLSASVHPDPVTGQLEMSFLDLPQVPFDSFAVHLFASQRGLLATPTHCTIYNVDSVFAPWNGSLAPQHSRPFLSLTQGPNGGLCPGEIRPFNPRLVAGSSTPVAGAFSSFHLRLDRDDGDQFLKDLNFRMPPGFTGSLRGISYCTEAQIAAAVQNSGKAEQAQGSCPASSQVGSSNVAAGPGTHPFHAVGRMYLAGPFKGAPLSLVAITPALAGPYDYGVVVVRVALHVDPHTAQVSAVSDTVPSIIGGVPIRMRSIQVNIDRPNFTINPTNCSPFSVDSQGIGDQGTTTEFSSYFHAVNCAALGFRPKMTITQLGSRKQTKRGQDPSLRFDLNTRAGNANLQSIAVTLPTAFGVDQRHLGNICSRAELASKHCEGRQAIGTVETTTPLLDQPLKGPAYAVSGFGRLPHIVFILAGQVTLLPEAESSSVKGGHLKTTVPVIPDAPIGHFRLTLFGGSEGYLQNSASLCHTDTATLVEYVGQNGKKLSQEVKPKVACPKSTRKSEKHPRPTSR
jgi:hypothetical protein